MNLRFIPLSLVLVVGVTSALGIRPQPATPAATPAPAEVVKPPPYVLKNKSAYGSASDQDQRAPFWPIGWTKRKPVLATVTPTHVVEAPKASIDEKTIKLTSVLLGNPSLAIINGRTYSEGEFLRVPKAAGAGAPATGAAAAGTLPSRVRVYRINDGAVVLQNQDQLITVALQRPELLQRSGVEDLLSEDRP